MPDRSPNLHLLQVHKNFQWAYICGHTSDQLEAKQRKLRGFSPKTTCKVQVKDSNIIKQ